jgi:hypothetical protein
MLFRFIIGALLALAAALPARAFTPESGFYWNPAEPGTGYNIEIQDNFFALTAYVFASDGRPQWYTATGLMSGNARYSGNLDGFLNGQCIGCPFRAPTAQLGAGGPITLEFTSETRANLTLGTRTFAIERFDFFLTRGAADPKTEMMLGEWQVLIDLYDRNGTQYQDYPYTGDLLLFDTIDRAETPDYFEGCRPTNSESGRCTSGARDQHDAAGFFSTSRNEHVLVVKDVPGTAFSDAVYFAYYVKLGTYQFDGVVEIYDEDETPGNGPFYPVRGFRTASRSFVQTGTGPSEDAKAEASAPRGLSSALAGRLPPRGLDAAEVRARYGIDPAALAPGAVAVTRKLAR